ncbi:MAG: hypothetical protein JWQ72_1916 [Polaromonas sp.]|nr:hypothetical protein [Polaromonas sp.]
MRRRCLDSGGRAAIRRLIARILCCAAAFACPALLLAPAAHAQSSPYGKTLVRSYEIPAGLLDRYNDAVQGRADAEALSKLENWVGVAFSAGGTASPYTLVVKVLGFAVEDDDLGVRWQLSWSGAPGAMSGMGASGIRPGQPVQLVVASEPVVFPADREVVPSLALAAAKNIRLERVRVEVWSGAGELSFANLLAEWWFVAAGVAVWAGVLLFLWHERRRAPAAEEVAEK